MTGRDFSESAPGTTAERGRRVVGTAIAVSTSSPLHPRGESVAMGDGASVEAGFTVVFSMHNGHAGVVGAAETRARSA